MRLILVTIFLASYLGSHAQSVAKAEDLLNQGLILEAKKELVLLVNSQPKNSKANYWLGVVLSAEYSAKELNPNKDPKPLIDAGVSFEKAIYLDSHLDSSAEIANIKAFQNKAYNAGVQNYQSSELEMAFTFFKMSSEAANWLNTPDLQSIYFAGHCANQIGEHQSAVMILEPAIQLDPSNEKLSKELLTAYMKVKDYSQAHSLINQTLVYHQSSKYFWYEYLSLSMKTEKLEEALKAAKQLSALDNNNAKNFALMASLYDQTGDTQMAIETYEKVLSLNPNDVQANFNLGVILYNQVIELNNSAATKENVKKSKELLDKAENYLLTAQTIDPGNMDIPVILENINSMK